MKIFSCGRLFAVLLNPESNPCAQGRLYDPDIDALSAPLPVTSILAHVPTDTESHWLPVAEDDMPARLRERLKVGMG